MTKFNDTELFCSKCGLSDHYWVGGGSWGIENCPRCKNQECVAWVSITRGQKKWAEESTRRWKEKKDAEEKG